jgi:hypothetical protein
MNFACFLWHAALLQRHHRSLLFAKLANIETPTVRFVANGRTYDKGYYYLADGFYPKWATFVKPLVSPSGKKQQEFHYTQA